MYMPIVLCFKSGSGPVGGGSTVNPDWGAGADPIGPNV